MGKFKVYFVIFKGVIQQKIFHYKILFRIKILRQNIHYTPGRNKLNEWFSLSYASWLTLPRVLVQEMPDEWQKKMAKLLEEYDRTWDLSSLEYGTTVRLTEDGKLKSMPEWLKNYRHPDHRIINSMRAKK